MPSDDAEPRESSWTRISKWLRRVGIGLVAAALLWLAAINLALWTGLAAAIVSGERPRSTIRLEHGWAWCVWPTRIHVDDLRLQIDGARWQLDIELPHGEADIELHQLLSRRFETAWIRGKRASFSFVVKKPHGTDPAQLEGFNRIEGFPEPILDAQPRPIPDKPWEVVLHEVNADLERLHVNAFDARIEGRLGAELDVKVTERFGLPRLTLEVAEGEVRHVDTPIFEGVSGRVALSLKPYNPRETRGRDVLRELSAEVAVRAAVLGLEWSKRAVEDLPVSLRQGEGTATAEVTMTEGELAPGARVVYQSDRVQARLDRESGASLSFDSQVQLELTVSAEDEGPPVRVSLECLDARAAAVGSRTPWVTAQQLSARAGFPSTDVVEGPGPLASASLDVPAFTMSDLGQVGRVGQKLRLRGGSATGRASARTRDDPEVFALDVSTDFEGLALTVGDSVTLRTDGHVDSKGTFRREGRTVTLEPLHAKLTAVAVQTERGQSDHDWLEVDGATVRYDAETERARARLQGRISDLRSVLAHLRPGEDIFQRIPRLGLGTDPVRVSMVVTRTRAGTQVDVDRFESPPVDIRAAVTRSGDQTRAAVYFTRAHVGLVTTGGGSRQVDVAVDLDWFRDKKQWVERALEH